VAVGEKRGSKGRSSPLPLPSLKDQSEQRKQGTTSFYDVHACNNAYLLWSSFEASAGRGLSPRSTNQGSEERKPLKMASDDVEKKSRILFSYAV